MSDKKRAKSAKIIHDQHKVAVSDLPQNGIYHFKLQFDDNTLDALREQFDIVEVTKLTFDGTVRADRTDGWVLSGHVGASAVQSCVVTLDPVKTRIDEPVVRQLLSTAPEVAVDDENTVEMDENVDFDLLGSELDLANIASEVVALHLPIYPRAPDAALENKVFSADGITPMSDDDAKPFASLAALRDKLNK